MTTEAPTIGQEMLALLQEAAEKNCRCTKNIHCYRCRVRATIAKVEAGGTPESTLLDALRWLAEMAGYAKYQVSAEWRASNGADLDDAIAQALEAINNAERTVSV